MVGPQACRTEKTVNELIIFYQDFSLRLCVQKS